MQYAKNFELESEKIQLKLWIYMQNTRNNAKCFKMWTWIYKEFRVSIRIYAVKRLKALALDSELIQILESIKPK